MVERTEMLTVVVSVYNEEAALPLCHERLTIGALRFWIALRRRILTSACSTFRGTSVMRPR